MLGLLGVVATLYIGLLKQKIENDRLFVDLFVDLFSDFNARYDERFNDLINKLKTDNELQLDLDERNLIIDYLNLCAEEYLWLIKGRVPDVVWHAWRSGILENLSVEQVKGVYREEIATVNGRRSFYGLAEELNKISPDLTFEN